MYESNLSPSASRSLGRSTSKATAGDIPFAGDGAGRTDSQRQVQQLREAIAILFAAVSSTLNDERESAEDCLTRVGEILQEEGASYQPPKATQGGLAPWQVRKVTAHIETNLDTPIRSSELAAIVRLSPCHFSRVFRESFGCCPLEYVTIRRMEHAQGLMLSTDTPLSQIALDCGFADQAHFSRLFRRFVGETPSAWRRARVSPAGSVASRRH